MGSGRWTVGGKGKGRMRRTDAQMRVNRGVSGGAGEVLVLAVGDVLQCARVAILLSQPEVDNVDQIPLFAQAHEEIVRFHISVDEVLRMDVFQSCYLSEEKIEEKIEAGSCKLEAVSS